MIEIDDIKKAIEENSILFYDGSEISLNAFKYLLEQKGTVIDSLFYKSEKKYTEIVYIFFWWTCPSCHQNYKIYSTRTKIKNNRKLGIKSFTHQEHNLGHWEELDLKSYLQSTLSKEKRITLDQICSECVSNLKNKMNKDIEDFFNNPLKWINTHTSDLNAWPWKKVSKLFTYPPDYEHKPEGWKYCGLRYLTKDSRQLKDMMDADYEKWRAIKEKTRPVSNVSSVHIGLKNTFGDKLYSTRASIAKKKIIGIVEDTLEGLLNGTSLPSILRHIISESTNILNKYDKFSSSSHILTFGKYKGYTVHDVIARDPEYICWALDTIEGFALDDNEWAHYLGKPWKMDADNSEIHEGDDSVSEDKNIENIEGDERNQENPGAEHS